MNAPELHHARPVKPGASAGETIPGERSPCARHLRLLAEFSHALQSAATLAEALQRFDEHLPRLFHTTGGAIYLFGSGSPPLRRVCAWGRAPCRRRPPDRRSRPCVPATTRAESAAVRSGCRSR